ncbi:carbonic anhydrase [Halorubrum vacuolatum]|uniref:carbonic anhydrase n=1 Tax=Halorubrum vacuolatum TaxID=63740 RepID=A0A238X8M6_HALVU|nr:carbonic anhydrase [Halorubrum vacuolatum]SNR54893.1 carbonic anhydrase [Halorubrum vacuolatum]
MSRRLLSSLLSGNDDHVAALAAEAFTDCREEQHPPVVSVCCSDSRVPQEGMFTATGPGFLFTAGNIGNRVRDRVDGEAVLDGSVAYPLAHADTEVVAVVGHTGCGAVGAAMMAAQEGTYPAEPGVRADVAELVPIVEEGLEHPAVDVTDGATSVHNQLVEHNVHEQVSFTLGSDEAADADVYGFVYDFHRAYGERDGAVYLVNANGERDPGVLRELVDDEQEDHVKTLLA